VATPSGQASRLASDSLNRHAAALVLLAALVGLRFAPALSFSSPLGDELAYDRAFAAAAKGESPYAEPGFLYPPVFARAGAWLRQAGPMAPLHVLRTANALGLVTLVWWSAGWLARGWRTRLAASAAVLLLSPAVYQGVALGNVSFLVAALVVAGLSIWPRFPISSGALLALSLAIKPLAPAAVLALGVHRPAGGGTKHRLAAVVAVALAAAAFLSVPGLGAFLERGSHSAVLASTVSPYRFVLLAGASPSPLVVTLPVLALLAWFVLRQPLSPAELTATAVVGAIAATPMVWNHTLLLTLPVQAMALATAWRRRRIAAEGTGGRALLELAVVALGVVALHTAEGATGITDRSPALQAAAALPAAIAPVLLLVYVLRGRDYAR
jgi:hypothetical protein